MLNCSTLCSYQQFYENVDKYKLNNFSMVKSVDNGCLSFSQQCGYPHGVEWESEGCG